MASPDVLQQLLEGLQESGDVTEWIEGSKPAKDDDGIRGSLGRQHVSAQGGGSSHQTGPRIGKVGLEALVFLGISQLAGSVSLGGLRCVTRDGHEVGVEPGLCKTSWQRPNPPDTGDFLVGRIWENHVRIAVAGQLPPSHPDRVANKPIVVGLIPSHG
jgi:hypothetical protein